MYEHITFAQGLGMSLLGFCIVFVALIFLMFVIAVMTKLYSASQKRKHPAGNTQISMSPAAASVPISAPASAPVTAPAPGSCGGLTLTKVSERDAAMVMAIVADELKAPLNELRFISIKEAE